MYNNEDIPRLDAGEKIRINIDFGGVSIRKRKKIPFLLILLLIVLALLGLLIFQKAKKSQSADLQVGLGDPQSADEWHGAFESKEIFDYCREASVSVIAEGRRCSGFVYSSDGWIATVEGVVNEGIKGQIEVIFCDGRRYFVEAFRQNRESGLILLKINAEGLKAVEIDKGANVVAGEELYTFCSFDGLADGGSLFSGKVAHIGRATSIKRVDGGERNLMLFQISILLTEEGEGAPLFNEDGALVGIACARRGEAGERYMVDYAFAFSDEIGRAHV